MHNYLIINHNKWIIRCVLNELISRIKLKRYGYSFICFCLHFQINHLIIQHGNPRKHHGNPRKHHGNPRSNHYNHWNHHRCQGIKRFRKPLTAEAKTAKSMKNRRRRTHQGIQSEREIDRTRFSKFRIYLAVEFSLVYSLDSILKYDLLNLIHKCNITCVINFNL